MSQPEEFRIQQLGTCKYDSPLLDRNIPDNEFIDHDSTILLDNRVKNIISAGDISQLPAFELSGPRKKIYFKPEETTAAIVTCGGLCPGINDVIRGLVMNMTYRYNLTNILGFRYGYRGMVERYNLPPINLTPDVVAEIHETGGTMLGSSRGQQDNGEIVDYLEKLGVDILFAIGGDGTQRGAAEIADEIHQRGSEISVVGIPKTIDNDILYMDKSFGFETAFSAATAAVQCAHTEAEDAYNGIGLVKLMGRQSGFIACHAAIACGLANYVLIPEVPFGLDGPHGLLELLRERLERRNHACIIVAEGAGQELLKSSGSATDPSGNIRFGDIGLYLKQRISNYFKEIQVNHTVKYIDPSYMIRSIPATPKDSLFCARLAYDAVHAALSGRTKMVIGRWNGSFVHIPSTLISKGRKFVEPNENVWQSVLEATGQPSQIG